MVFPGFYLKSGQNAIVLRVTDFNCAINFALNPVEERIELLFGADNLLKLN